MPTRKLGIMVAGGFDKDLSPAKDIEAFVRALGRQIIKQGHTLLGGCRTELDAFVAEAAYQALFEQAISKDLIRNRIVSYVLKEKKPIHQYGAVLESDLADWDLGGLELNAPEIIRYADAVILVGGFAGTYRAANWARLERKPLLPLSFFGGAAKAICVSEVKRAETAYPGIVTKQAYEAVLKSLSSDRDQLAADTVNLAERMATSRDVFIVMSFADTPQYKDVEKSIKESCAAYEYNANRIDRSNDDQRIIPEIIRGIRQCAFVVADVTEEKPNVYWELGLAGGMGKEIILVAKKGTALPFDVVDIPVLFWESFSDFTEALKQRIEKIASRQGRA